MHKKRVFSKHLSTEIMILLWEFMVTQRQWWSFKVLKVNLHRDKGHTVRPKKTRKWDDDESSRTCLRIFADSEDKSQGQTATHGLSLACQTQRHLQLESLRVEIVSDYAGINAEKDDMIAMADLVIGEPRKSVSLVRRLWPKKSWSLCARQVSSPPK